MPFPADDGQLAVIERPEGKRAVFLAVGLGRYAHIQRFVAHEIEQRAAGDLDHVNSRVRIALPKYRQRRWHDGDRRGGPDADRDGTLAFALADFVLSLGELRLDDARPRQKRA